MITCGTKALGRQLGLPPIGPALPLRCAACLNLPGTSSDSWEKAAANAVEQAAKSLRDLRIAEVVKLDMQLDDKGKVEAYRAKLNVSFKFEGS
ncbi:Flavin-binding protein dodecin [Bradyrhizobium sp. Rc2d]|uniref:dodecin family protein n=1 Tax=Bradyrhizobium sp. Rc2d TaxID=1855321 RepID=UPI00087E6554|nr:dodecin domain-containing protein [Bradyrhizobium sp. Rc2d]SDK02746.1 Flavin-binding protein dodecin [Bradyrhizobium sp. Rc2d]